MLEQPPNLPCPPSGIDPWACSAQVHHQNHFPTCFWSPQGHDFGLEIISLTWKLMDFTLRLLHRKSTGWLWYSSIIGLICFNIGVLTVDEYYSSLGNVLMEATVTQTAMKLVGPGSDTCTITNKSIFNPHLLWSLGGLDQYSGVNRLQLIFVSILIFRPIDKLKP